MEVSEPILFENLKTWASLVHPIATGEFTSPSKQPLNTPIFSCSDQLNSKICLWNGPIWRLQIDGIVNSTNETLTDKSGLCRNILDAAGKQIWVECEAAGVCRTGEAIITRGCQLPARHIIHTVGPRYNLKYHNAAENALHNCYRSVLTVAKQEQLRSVALSCIYTKKKAYPRDEAAHIATRTVRRFLEHYGDDFDRVIFCVDTLEDQLIYENILQLYFPRTRAEEEQQAQGLASRDLGDAFGEPIIEERKIRIRSFTSSPQYEDNQHTHIDDDDGQNSTDDEETAMLDFRAMSCDPDLERLERLQQLQHERQRLENKAAKDQQKEVTMLNYQLALEQAQQQDFGDLRALGFLYNAGVDHSGSPVMVYLGSNLPVAKVDLDQVMLYVIQTMDAIVEKQYSVLYVHSGVKDENQPNASWLKRLFRTFASKYQTNLKFFYILEPTIWLKLLILVAKGFVSKSFYRKIVYLSESKEIDNIAPYLKLPTHIYTKHETNGTNQDESIDHEDWQAPGFQNKRDAVL